MADINLSLSAAFQNAFGYQSAGFNPEFKGVVGFKDGEAFSGGRAEYGSAAAAPFYGQDIFGREYFLPIIMTYPTFDKATQSWSGPNVVLELPWCVVSMECEKKIIETELTEGNRGSFFELINTGNYRLNIKGFLISQTNELPEGMMTDIRNLFECGASVAMSCALTDIFLVRPDRAGSDGVIIKGIKLPGVTGVKNVWAYEFDARSSAPFNLVDIS